MRFWRWRKMSWVLAIWTGIFLAWIIGGIASRPSQDCPPGDQFCVNASDAGTGIGVGLIIVFWFIGFVVLSLVWFMTRPRDRRECPVCGNDVKKGVTVCGLCGHDFKAALVTSRTAAPASAATAAVQPVHEETRDEIP